MNVPRLDPDPRPRVATSGPPRARRRWIAVAGLVLGATAIAAGCGSSTTTASTATSAAPTTAATTTGSAETSGTTTRATKVSANAASSAEITAALTAAGVTNAARWTKEIEEYRPYPTDDPTLAKLRKELAKYNPSADQLEKIIGALQP